MPAETSGIPRSDAPIAVLRVGDRATIASVDGVPACDREPTDRVGAGSNARRFAVRDVGDAEAARSLLGADAGAIDVVVIGRVDDASVARSSAHEAERDDTCAADAARTALAAITRVTDAPVVVLGVSGIAEAEAFDLGAADWLPAVPASPADWAARLVRHATMHDVVRDRGRLAERLAARNDDLAALNTRLADAVVDLTDDVAAGEQRFARLRDVGAAIGEIQDLDRLFERVLLEARRMTRAEAGAIFVLEGAELVFRLGQNDALAAGGRDVSELARGFRVPIALGSIAGTTVETGEVINVADVHAIEPGAGFHFLTSLDERVGYRTRALLTAPLRTPAARAIGILQVANPRRPSGHAHPAFDEEDVALVRHFASIAGVALERARLTRTMVMRMIRMAETRDPTETGAHVERVAAYALLLFGDWAAARGLPTSDPVAFERRRDLLSIAAKLHDVGKIGIPDAVLKKPGPLDDREYALVQQHVVIGARLFAGAQTEFDAMARAVALHHHERWDGQGYPGAIDPESPHFATWSAPRRGGLAGEAIPIEARLVGLADVLDALLSPRSYKVAWPVERVIEFIRGESGRHFDPELAAIALRRLDDILAIRRRYEPAGP